MSNPTSAAENERDRRGTFAAGNRLLGRVIGCSGSKATVSAPVERDGSALAELWSVGRLISISVGPNRVVALVCSMKTASAAWNENGDNVMHIELELVGEIRPGVDGKTEFGAGISRYPYLGAVAHRMRSSDLAVIYDPGTSDTAVIGSLTQDPSLGALIHVPSLLSRHFAVVGTTGVGKTTAVTLLLHKALQADPSLRVLILDPHNEFAAAFPTQSVVIDTETLDLPFWLFRLEELTEVLFRGRPPIPEEIDVLR
ncbi:ATP-binding protein, partial [Hoeflea olei]|uniref:ATP-binding protein n=1 Tax=Hoeflea olei TaxID=1480615 RepID=UPI001FD968FB